MATAQRLCRMLVAIWQRRGYRRGRRFELCGGELSTFGTHRCGLGGIGGAESRGRRDCCAEAPADGLVSSYAGENCPLLGHIAVASVVSAGLIVGAPETHASLARHAR